MDKITPEIKQFTEEWGKMCQYYNHDCGKCQFHQHARFRTCTALAAASPETLFAIIKGWARDNNVPTRMSQWLESNPNAETKTCLRNQKKYIDICPRCLDKSHECNKYRMCIPAPGDPQLPLSVTAITACEVCKSEYWNEKI